MTDTEVAATAFAVVSAATSALVWWMTREAAAGRITRTNRTFGIRTKRTKSSDEAWMRGHQVALPWTVVGRYVAGLFAVAALVAVGADREAPLGLALGLGGIATVIVVYLGAVLAINRALPEAATVAVAVDEVDTGEDARAAELPPG